MGNEKVNLEEKDDIINIIVPDISDEKIQEYIDILSAKKDTNDIIEGEGDELEICIAGAEQILAHKKLLGK